MNKREMFTVEVSLLFNNNYLVLSKIGEGGFGVVWKAIDLSLKNFVVIKRLNPELSQNVRFVEMFYNEAVIARNLVHDNIVRTHHFWHDEKGNYYILMDYVKGSNLDYLIKRAREKKIENNWQTSVFIVAGICKVLDYLHRLAKQPLTGNPYNIVFMDLTPSNVMVSFEGDVKITDFGIAKVNRNSQAVTKTTVIAGKYSYMSPEQILCDPNIDYRTDIFSAGLILYELLTGNISKIGKVEEAKQLILNTNFDFDSIKNTPLELVEILKKSLKRKKEERYSSALEMYRDLRALLSSKSTEELKEEFAGFVCRVLSDELEKEREVENFVRNLDFASLITSDKIGKIKCYDFIPGSSTSIEQKGNNSSTTSVIQEKEKKVEGIGTIRNFEVEQESTGKVEEKGKTVFEEVGNWLVQQVKLYRRRILVFISSFLVSVFIFLLLDTFIPSHITPIGRRIYGFIFPPNVIITIVPGGAKVSVIARNGDRILDEEYVSDRVELRKLKPGSYEVFAFKEGLKPIQQIISIDPYLKSKTQNIELIFNVVMFITSNPEGADIYLNGSKVGITPWRGEVVAQKIAVQLDYPGFEKLGSSGKEQKEGMCFLDFTQNVEQLIFSKVDSKFWSWSSSNSVVAKHKIYNLHGNMYRKIKIDSSPQDLLVFVDDSLSTVGMTPLSLNLPAGWHVIKLSGNPQYEETSTKIYVASNTPQEFFVSLRKWITIYAYDKETSQLIRANYKMSSDEVSFEGVTLPEKPASIAVPVRKYLVEVIGSKKYKPTWVNIDVKTTNKVSAYLELRNPVVNFYVSNVASAPVRNAYIWLGEKVVGKTDSKGYFSVEVLPGNTKIKVIADKYKVYTTTKTFYPAKDENLYFVLEIDKIKCSSCGREYPSDTKLKFCIECGAPLQK